MLSPFLLGWIMAMYFTVLISMRIFISSSSLNIYLHFSCLLFCSCSVIASVKSSQAAVWAC